MFITLLALMSLVVPALSRPISLQADGGQRLRIAIVGLVHSHAWGHLRNMARSSLVELAAIAEPIADLREVASREAPGVELYDDYRRMLTEKKPQAVWAFVENDRHLEITKECAARGIHVIFEKPMSATVAEARQMLSLAQKHKIKLMVNYQMAWWPTNYTAYSTAGSGALGRVWRVRTIIGHGGPAPSNPNDKRGQHFWAWLNDEKRGGGALMDFTCYGGVWLRWYLGKPKTVYAVTTRTRPDVYKTNTNATVLATFDNNGIGLIEGSWDLPRGFQDLEVFGNRGSLHMDRQKVETVVGRERKEVPTEPLGDDRRDPITYFVSRVRGDQPIEGMVSPEFNVDVMEIVEAARRSAASGRPVSLPLK